ncbi:MAG: ABC transporter permease [Anaerolineae bacterium]
MNTKADVPAQLGIVEGNPLLFLHQLLLLVKRNLITMARMPWALIPPFAMSVFLVIIYESTLGKASSFIPSLEGDYLSFILPLSIVTSSVAGAGISAQNLVRDLEGGYFDKLLITPLDRAVLLLSPILAGAVMLGLQASAVLVVGLLLGLNSATGLAGLVAVVAFSVLLGTGFAGFTVSAALASGSAAVTESATFVFVPLTFIAPTFVPIALLDGWLKTAASLNPITYVLQAMRTLLSTGWDIEVMWKGVLACLLLALLTYSLAVIALRVRTRRS